MNFELRSSNFLGVDVGGTTTRVGVVGANARPWIVDRFATPGTTGLLLDRIIAGVEKTSWHSAGDGIEPDAIGIALPGPIDRDRGVLLRSVHLPFLEQVPIVHELHRRTSLRTVLTTDAEAATWGEYSARGSRAERFIHLRFGTGVACGMVLRGELQPTDADRRTHLPALVVDERVDAPVCACGLRGCLELFAGGQAIPRLPIEEIAFWIVRGIGNLVDPPPCRRGSDGKHRVASAPHSGKQHRAASAPRSDRECASTVVCMGGGVLVAVPALFEAVRTRWNAQSESERSGVKIQIARLGDDAGVVGAALLVGR